MYRRTGPTYGMHDRNFRVYVKFWSSQAGNIKNQHLLPSQQMAKNYIIDGPPCICALGDLTDFVDESISSNLQFRQVIQFGIMAYQIYTYHQFL